jgi:hypothetical protein
MSSYTLRIILGLCRLFGWHTTKLQTSATQDLVRQLEPRGLAGGRTICCLVDACQTGGQGKAQAFDLFGILIAWSLWLQRNDLSSIGLVRQQRQD